MTTVSVLELKKKTSKLVRSIVNTGEKIQITENGEVVALLVPLHGSRESASGWTTLDKLVTEIKAKSDRE